MCPVDGFFTLCSRINVTLLFWQLQYKKSTLTTTFFFLSPSPVDWKSFLVRWRSEFFDINHILFLFLYFFFFCKYLFFFFLSVRLLSSTRRTLCSFKTDFALHSSLFFFFFLILKKIRVYTYITIPKKINKNSLLQTVASILSESSVNLVRPFSDFYPYSVAFLFCYLLLFIYFFVVCVCVCSILTVDVQKITNM